MGNGVRFLEFEVEGERVLIALEHITKIKGNTKSNSEEETWIRTADGGVEIIQMPYDAVKNLLKYAEER